MARTAYMEVCATVVPPFSRSRYKPTSEISMARMAIFNICIHWYQLNREGNPFMTIRTDADAFGLVLKKHAVSVTTQFLPLLDT
jgi:hypothetical protein